MDFEIHVIPDPVNLILQLIATVILFAILSKFLYKPVKDILEKRREGIASNVTAAEEEKKQAELLKKEYEAQLVDAQAQGKKIVDESRQRGEDMRQQIVEEAQSEAQKIKERALKDIERERQKVQNEVKDEIASIALLAAEKIIGKNLDATTQKNLIDQFIEEAGENQWQN